MMRQRSSSRRFEQGVSALLVPPPSERGVPRRGGGSTPCGGCAAAETSRQVRQVREVFPRGERGGRGAAAPALGAMVSRRAAENAEPPRPPCPTPLREGGAPKGRGEYSARREIIVLCGARNTPGRREVRSPDVGDAQKCTTWHGRFVWIAEGGTIHIHSAR